MHTITQTGLPTRSTRSTGSRVHKVSPALRCTHALPATLSPHASDDALIQEIAGGDRRAMEVLYTRHQVRVYRFSLRITANTAVAEDIVSEVFLISGGKPARSNRVRRFQPGYWQSLATREWRDEARR